MGTLIIFGVGLVAVIAGVIFLWFRQKTKQKIALMGRMATSSAGSLSSMPPGELVEVKGTLRCEAPITSELAQRSCAYFNARVIREYTVQDRDSDGRYRTSRRSETVASNTQFAPFAVEDDTGRVNVNAERAEVDAEDVMNRFESGGGGPGVSISLGGLSIDTGGHHNTVGYRYQENVLTPDTPVYVLGALQQGGSIGAPAEEARDQKLLISYRSEEEFAKSLGKTAMWQMVGAIIAFVIAAGLFTIGFTVRF